MVHTCSICSKSITFNQVSVEKLCDKGTCPEEVHRECLLQKYLFPRTTCPCGTPIPQYYVVASSHVYKLIFLLLISCVSYDSMQLPTEQNYLVLSFNIITWITACCSLAGFGKPRFINDIRINSHVLELIPIILLIGFILYYVSYFVLVVLFDTSKLRTWTNLNIGCTSLLLFLSSWKYYYMWLVKSNHSVINPN